MSNLVGKRVVLGVSGGIAAYKAVDLASKLVQAGAIVDVTMTHAATEFLRPLSFEAITKRRVHIDVFEPWSETEKGHISLADEADLIVIAPATANTIARIAYGMADDMLSVTLLSAAPRGIPVIIAPAMEHHMYIHPATQANLATLQGRGATVIGPEYGRLASGAVGQGRLAANERIVGAIEQALGRTGLLAGRHIVVSAGATREAIDPIRILTNRSTGKMGYAVARAAIQAGARVTLLSMPTNLPPIEGAEIVQLESALDLYEAVKHHAVGSDALIMAAAVADYRPIDVAADKIKKSDDDMAIKLTRNPDILASVETPGTVRVGFAAETRDLEVNARGKLERKNLDMIIANDARQAMGNDDNAVTIYYRDGRDEQLELDAKSEIAVRIVERVADLLFDRDLQRS